MPDTSNHKQSQQQWPFLRYLMHVPDANQEMHILHSDQATHDPRISVLLLVDMPYQEHTYVVTFPVIPEVILHRPCIHILMESYYILFESLLHSVIDYTKYFLIHLLLLHALISQHHLNQSEFLDELPSCRSNFHYISRLLFPLKAFQRINSHLDFVIENVQKTKNLLFHQMATQMQYHLQSSYHHSLLLHQRTPSFQVWIQKNILHQSKAFRLHW